MPRISYLPKSTLVHDNCLSHLKTMSNDSVDSMVTDPPYGISFMNNKWDYDIPSVEIWKECLRVLKPGGNALVACGTRNQHKMASNLDDAGFEIRDIVAWIYSTGFPKGQNLKPAMELWTLIRKPIRERRMPANIRKWGTGKVYTQENRIPFKDEKDKKEGQSVRYNENENWRLFPDRKKKTFSRLERATIQGRIPSNVIHDGSEGVIDTFPPTRDGGETHKFFYCAKPSKKERGESKHPTMKPVKLMRHLCRLITPPQGIIIDPFMGSGSTGVAATLEGFSFIGIETEEEYCHLAEKRIRESLSI